MRTVRTMFACAALMCSVSASAGANRDLMWWAAHLSGRAVPEEMPAIRYEPHDFFLRYYCEGRKPCDVQGWYPGRIGAARIPPVEAGTIYLDEALRAAQPVFHDSVIVHEMVHYLQERGGAFGTPGCTAWLRAERAAYRAQNLYLARHRFYIFFGQHLATVQCHE